MPGPHPALRRSGRERLQAWVVTGPPGHLWSAAVDIVVIWTRWLAHRARQRIEAGAGSAFRRLR
jgi:hypothetical protein